MTEAIQVAATQEEEATLSIPALVEEIGHYLPSQHPLDFFIHHNTLHAFEDLPFKEALQEADRLFGTHSLRKEEDYFADFQKGRISLEDLDAILHLSPEQTESMLGMEVFTSFPQLWKRLILREGLQPPTEGILSWRLFEQGELRHFPKRLSREAQQRHEMAFHVRWNTLLKQADDAERGWFLTGSRDPERVASLLETYYRLDTLSGKELEARSYSKPAFFTLTSLWLHCLAWTEQRPPRLDAPLSFQRHRDVFLAREGEDLDNQIHPILLRFFSRFCDQGMSNQPMPCREHGMLRAFVEIFDPRTRPLAAWLKKALVLLRGYLAEGRKPEEIIALGLEKLQVEKGDHKSYLSAMVFSLRGWMGMIQKLEQRPDYLHHPEEKPSLLEAVALHTTLEAALWQEEQHERPDSEWMAKPWREIRSLLKPTVRDPQLDAYHLFQCCLYAGITTEEWSRASDEQKQKLAQDIESFDDFSRAWTWHLAYERHYYQQMAAGIRENIKENQSLGNKPERPSFQMACCIDEREESFRRHIEEIDPKCETLGVAGFFGMDMRFRGIHDAHARPLCPPVISPDKHVEELPYLTHEAQMQAWEESKKKRRMIGLLRWHGLVTSRMPIRGFLWTLFIGLLNLGPMILRILVPRTAKRLEDRIKAYVTPPVETYTTFLKDKPEGKGFSHDELLARVVSILRVMGLTRNFAPLVFLTGHGSTSRNNPHEAAHDCGACGGGRGGPNARVFAATVNNPAIRESLRTQHQIDIPDDTWFVGSYHDTCSDVVEFYEIERIPESHKQRFAKAREIIDEARRRNAHERCRRFESVPLQSTPAEALYHVEGRSNDIAEPRPEYGHATNAICIVGRREMTRGLFLDRRAFLVSYDATQDPEAKSLTGLLGAVGPVCVGINLEYFFSYVNNSFYGSGTKLPHNISGYVGVINGNLSDLQTGLPWQMVEIHEPVRLLMFIEQTREQFLRAIASLPYVTKLIHNQWLHIALIDPHTQEFFLWEEGRFVAWENSLNYFPKVLDSSIWYQGKREHLPPARVLASLPPAPSPSSTTRLS